MDNLSPRRDYLLFVAVDLPGVSAQHDRRSLREVCHRILSESGVQEERMAVPSYDL